MEGVVTNAEGFDVVCTEFEQVRFDPLFKVGTQWRCVDFCYVDDILRWYAYESLLRVLRIFLADDQVHKRVAFGVSELDECPDTISTFGLLLFVWLKHTEEFLIVSLFASDIEYLQSDEEVGRFAHLFVGVGWIVLVGRKCPNTGLSVLSNFEFIVLFRIGIVFHDLERGSIEWIGEFFEQYLIDSR